MDRRRIELIEPGLSAAPIHYESRRLDVAATAALVAKVRASVVRATSAALDEIASALPAPVRLDLAPSVAARLPRRHRGPAPPAVRGPGRRHHVPPGARRARARSRLGRPPLRREGRARSSGRHAGRAGPTRSCRGLGRRWGRPGRRTTGSRSPRRSWPAESGLRDRSARAGTSFPRPSGVQVDGGEVRVELDARLAPARAGPSPTP